MTIEIINVASDKKLLKAYLDFPHKLYQDDENYVPELYMAQKDLFNRKKNPFFKHSEAESFLAMSDGQIVGRISAILNNNYNKYHNSNVGFFGFFDVIDNYEVAQSLFETACQWCRNKGLEAVLGPTNFSTNDTAGMLIDGFHEPPKILMTYNKPYYNDFAARFGFVKDMDLLAYILYTKKASEKSIRLAQSLEERLSRQGITFRSITKKSLKEDVLHVREIYNNAWAKNWGFVPMTDDEINHLANELTPILHPEWCYIAEDRGQPVGFGISLHNINEITHSFKKGRIFPFNVFKLLFNRHKTRYVRIIALGVKKDYRKKGIEAIFFAKNILAARKNDIIAGEVSWVLENNEEMNSSAVKLNSDLYKRYRIYRYDL